jgi:ParB family chromosome partitioning protein
MARTPKLGLPLQTLRNAPDALAGRRLRGGIVEIEPDSIETAGRLADRLQIEIADLKASISRNGQRVPILVRPLEEDRYSLVYGRRRLEACRELGIKARAIVTEVDGDQAVRDQLLENQERRDLSFIERALVASALIDGDHLGEAERTNKGIAEVLNLTEAGVSQLLSVVRAVGEELVLAIGPAPGIGRPRWEELKKALAASDVDHDRLAVVATEAKSSRLGGANEKSDAAFLAVLAAAGQSRQHPSQSKPRRAPGMVIPGVGTATVTTGRHGKQLKLDLKTDEADFVGWLEGQAPHLIAELHERWRRSEN